VEWSSVLRRSKESARRVGSSASGVNARSRGPMAPLQLQQQHHQHQYHHQQQQQQQHHQQQHLQSSSSRQRSFRERNRNRGGGGGGFGAAGPRGGGAAAGDMGRYTTNFTCDLSSVCVSCTSPTLNGWLMSMMIGWSIESRDANSPMPIAHHRCFSKKFNEEVCAIIVADVLFLFSIVLSQNKKSSFSRIYQRDRDRSAAAT